MLPVPVCVRGCAVGSAEEHGVCDAVSETDERETESGTSGDRDEREGTARRGKTGARVERPEGREAGSLALCLFGVRETMVLVRRSLCRYAQLL